MAARPVLITIGAPVAMALGGMWLLSLPLSLVGIGSYALIGSAVSGGEYLTSAGPAAALLGGLCFASGLGLWQGRRWARSTALLYWVVLGAVAMIWMVVFGAGWGALLMGPVIAIPFFASSWYLYSKAEVVSYFGARRSSAAEGRDDRSDAFRDWVSASPPRSAVLAIAAGGCVWLGFVMAFRNSEPYRTALEEARADVEIIERLGEPIDDGFVPSGQITRSQDGGLATLSFVLEGPRGSARIASEVLLTNDGWSVEERSVRFDSRRPVDGDGSFD